MSSFAQFQDNIKNISLNAVEASKPSGIFFGTVLSVSPLEIQVEQKMTLTAEFLVLSTLVQDFKVNMTVDHQTEEAGGGSGEAAYDSHSHEYRGMKEFLVHLGLKSGEKVIMIRIQGGQQFLVLDRVRG